MSFWYVAMPVLVFKALQLGEVCVPFGNTWVPKKAQGIQLRLFFF